jgi:hypothetical protein
LFASLIATSALYVSGCQTTNIYAPTSSNAQDFATAKAECLNDPDVVNATSNAIATVLTPASGFYSLGAHGYFNACMKEHGWVPERKAAQSQQTKVPQQAAGGDAAGKSQLPEPEPKNAKWIFVAKGTNGTFVYVDAFDAVAVGDKRRAWFKYQFTSQNFRPVTNDPRWSSEAIGLQEFDCSQGNSSHSVLELVEYDHLSDGTTYAQRPAQSLTAIPAGSLFEHSKNYVCGVGPPGQLEAVNNHSSGH